MYSLQDWFNAEAAEHNEEWAQKIIRLVRFNMSPLVSLETAERGMAYLLSKQEMSSVRNLFQNTLMGDNDNGVHVASNGQTLVTKEPLRLQGEMHGIDFKPLPIWEKLMNVLIAEMVQMGPIVEVQSVDPTSTEKKAHDRALIKNKKIIEGLLSYVYTSIGQQPYSMDQHKPRFGDKPDNGNTQDFMGMGLNPGDPEDIKFFMETFHKLDEEIAMQDVIDFLNEYNQVTEKIVNWAMDLIAKKALGAQIYVSEINGSIAYEYVSPETIFIYGGGRRRDFNDANSKVIEKNVTVKQMLDMIGNEFDFDTHWDSLIIAINYANKVEITGIKPGGRSDGFYCEDKLTKSLYSYDNFLSFRIAIGYIEWNSQIEADAKQGKKKKPKKNNDPLFQNNPPYDGQKYATKAKYETPMYKAYYLVVSSFDQIMFNFGKLPYQDIEGYNDVSNAYTIITYKQPGDPLSIATAPFVDIINEAWYKWKYELRRAKPRGRGWNLESILEMAEQMIPDAAISAQTKVEKMLSLMNNSANELYVYPEIDGKKTPIPGNQMNFDIPNGISKETMEWWNVIVQTWDKMLDTVGIAPLRQGDPGNARDSMNNQFKALEYSEKATYYIPNILTTMFEYAAERTMFYVQDIVNYKEYDTQAYQFLLTGVGEETLSKIEDMGKTGMRRMGIFVEALNQAPQRAKLDSVLMQSIQTGAITPAQYMLISDIKSPKKAYLTLAFLEQRNKKLAQQSEMQAQQQKAQSEQQMEQLRQQTEHIKGDYGVMVAKIQAAAMVQSHSISSQAGITRQDMKQNADSEQIYQQAHADLLAQSAQAQQSVTPPAPPQGQQHQGFPAPQQGTPESVIQQEKDAVVPAPPSAKPE